MKKPKKSDVEQVYGPCPDCGAGPCIMNCGEATIDVRCIIAATVLQIEATKSARERGSMIRVLKRIHPSFAKSALAIIKERAAK